jgi:hypothetical protein
MFNSRKIKFILQWCRILLWGLNVTLYDGYNWWSRNCLPFGANEFTTGWFLLSFCSFMSRVLWAIVVLSSISFNHCIVCPLIHDFWLCLRFFLQSFLNISPNYENMFEKKCLWEMCVKIWFALAKRCFSNISAISIMAIIFTSGGHQSAWNNTTDRHDQIETLFWKINS